MVMGFMFPSARVLRVPRVPEAVALVHVHTEPQPVARAVSLARAVERLHQLPGGRHVREGATAACRERVRNIAWWADALTIAAVCLVVDHLLACCCMQRSADRLQPCPCSVAPAVLPRPAPGRPAVVRILLRRAAPVSRAVARVVRTVHPWLRPVRQRGCRVRGRMSVLPHPAHALALARRCLHAGRRMQLMAVLPRVRAVHRAVRRARMWVLRAVASLAYKRAVGVDTGTVAAEIRQGGVASLDLVKHVEETIQKAPLRRKQLPVRRALQQRHHLNRPAAVGVYNLPHVDRYFGKHVEERVGDPLLQLLCRPVH